MIRYYKLFDFLNRHGMKKTDLLQIISAPTLAKISKGQNIQTDVIDKICLFLHCQPSDIMEVVSYESETSDKDLNVIFVPQEEITPEMLINMSDNTIAYEDNEEIKYVKKIK